MIRRLFCTREVCATRLDVAEVRERADSVSLLHGVGWKRARALERIGITTFEELLSTESEAVVVGLKPHKHVVSVAAVDARKHQARAYKNGKPVWFGTEPTSFDAATFRRCSSGAMATSNFEQHSQKLPMRR